MARSIVVSNSAELYKALNTAKGGETILLAGGQYGSLNLSPKTLAQTRFASEVTIKSLDAGNLATFTGGALVGVKNLTLDSLKFELTPTASSTNDQMLLSVKSWSPTKEKSENIKILNSQFIGHNSEFGGDAADYRDVAAHDHVVKGMPTGIGLNVRGADNVLIENNDISGFHRGAVFGTTSNLVVKGNDVHDIRSDGLDFAQVQKVLIENNEVYDMRPYRYDGPDGKEAGDHGDLIQFWTAGTTQPSTDVTIRGNFLHTSSGDVTQSIFMRNEVVDRGQAGEEMYYKNITIVDNVIYNAHAHGISLGAADGVTIGNNTLVHNPDVAGYDGVTIPGIRVNPYSENVMISGNIVPSAISYDPAKGWAVGNNLITQNLYLDQPNYVGDVFINPFSGRELALSDLQIQPGSAAANTGAGSVLNQFDTTPVKLAGFVDYQSQSGLSSMTVAFDAAKIYGPKGLANLDKAKYLWTFDDGSVSTSKAPVHAYGHAGIFKVQVQVTLENGQQLMMQKSVSVQNPIALQLDFGTGVKDVSPIATDSTIYGTYTLENGISGKALRLTSEKSYVQFARTPEFAGNNEITMLVNFKKDAADSGGRLLYFTGNAVISLGKNSLTLIGGTSTGDKISLKAASEKLADTDWHQVAYTFSKDAGTAVLYLDGVELARQTGLTGSELTSATSFFIGDPFSANFFKGLIDNVQLLNGAMTPEQVKSSFADKEHLFSLESVAHPEIPAPISQPPVPEPQKPVSLMEKLHDVQAATAQTVDAALVKALAPDLNFIQAASGAKMAVGTAAGDMIAGTAGADIFKTLDGNDIILTGGGNNHANAGAGDDIVIGGDGDDYLNGQTGYDIVLGGHGNDTIYGNKAYGGAGNDLIRGEAETNDELWGEDGEDVLMGYGGRDQLHGGAGNDTLKTGSGNDVLRGGDGDDILQAGAGNDVLYGGQGADMLSGGAGGDIFIFEKATAFNGIDKIADFKSAEGDKIDVSAILEGFDPLHDAIGDFIRLTGGKWSKNLEVDVKGGGDHFIAIATISNPGDDIAALIAKGSLIVA